MARIFQNSFEVNSTTTGLDGINFVASPTLSTTNPHSVTGSDNRHLVITSLVSGTAKHAYIVAAIDGQGPYYAGQAMKFVTWPTADNTFIMFLDLASTGWVVVKIGSTGLIKLFNQATQIGSSFQLSLDQYYHIVLYVDKTPAAGSEVARLYVNGQEVAGASNLTLDLDGLTYWLMGGNILGETQTTGEWYFDDIAINDTTGSSENGIMKEEYMVGLWPNAAGDSNAWTRGGADSGANWSQNDENPHNDDTDYVESNTLNQKDLYNISAPTFQDDVRITVVQIAIRRRGAGASANATFVPIIKSIAEDEGTATSDSNNVYDITVPEIRYFQSNGTTPWTKGAITSAQIGMRLSATSTNAIRITNIRLTVAFRLIPNARPTLLFMGGG